MADQIRVSYQFDRPGRHRCSRMAELPPEEPDTPAGDSATDPDDPGADSADGGKDSDDAG